MEKASFNLAELQSSKLGANLLHATRIFVSYLYSLVHFKGQSTWQRTTNEICSQF